MYEKADAEAGAVSLAGFREHLAVASSPAWRATLVVLAAGESPAFRVLCAENGIAVLDTIDDQLAELARVRFPAHDQDDRRRNFVASERADDAYGAWAYLPW